MTALFPQRLQRQILQARTGTPTPGDSFQVNKIHQIERIEVGPALPFQVSSAAADETWAPGVDWEQSPIDVTFAGVGPQDLVWALRGTA